MPVLYGVFLYMGVASLNGVQVSSLKTELGKPMTFSFLNVEL